MTKKIEKIICGKKEKDIRKAYFQKKLPQLLNEIQAEKKYSVKEIDELGAYLTNLQSEGDEFLQEMQKVFGGKIIEDNRPPSVEELREGMDDKEWREKADKAAGYIEKTLDSIRHNIAEKKPFSSSFWGDTALVFISMQSVLEKDLIFKRQLYKVKLTQIIDKSGTSRKEAEERAELTREYFDYKTLAKLMDRLEEFYTFARRRDDEINHKF